MLEAAIERDELELAVRHLASIERASCSAGEHQAAEWIVGRLRERGLEARLEEERAHGTYWIPLGLLSALGAIAGLAALRGRRGIGLVAGAAAAAGIADEVGGGSQQFRRRLLSKRRTWNAVAETGDPGARRTVVILAHHDAARSGLVFHPGVLPLLDRHAPALLENAETSPPLLAPVFLGPAAVAAGSLLGRRGLMKLGVVFAAGSAAAFANIAASRTVPGANDNLTGVAVLLGLARSLTERPVEGLRVVLASCGSEESFQEGVTAFIARHGSALPPETTDVICVDTVGSPMLCVPEGEGMLLMRDYDPAMKDLLSECAEHEGIPLRRGLRFSLSTDTIPWMLRGHRAVMLGSINRLKVPSNYHWPSDHADNVDYERVADATRLVDSAVRRLSTLPKAS